MSKSGFITTGPTRSLALSLVAAVLLAFDAAAQATPPTRARGEVRGRVVSAETQAPIGGARVELTGSGSADSLTRAASGTDGRFRVQGLRPGAYRLRISALGFSPRELARGESE